MPSSASPVQDIPQEIFDQITDHVAQTCRPSLSNLSLSSRQHFLHYARSYIFHTIQISNPRNIAQLLEIGDNDPLLFTHTRSLHLSIRLYCYDHGFSTALQRFATGLRSLRALHVEGFHPGLQGRRAIYPEMNPFFREAVKAILLTQPIAQLSLHHLYDFPVDLILPLRSLDRLDVTGWSKVQYNRLLFSMAPGLITPSVGVTWRLRTLKCDEGGTSIIPFILAGPRAIYNGLVRLNLTIMKYMHHEAAWSLLKALSGSTALEHLCLAYAQDLGPAHGESFSHIRDLRDLLLSKLEPLKTYDPPFYLVFILLNQLSRSSTTLPFLPSLLSLRLTFEADDDDIAAGSLYMFMADFPSTILAQHSRPSLQVLKVTHVVTSKKWGISEYWGNFGRAPLNPMSNQVESWSRLDGILADELLLPCLQAMSMTIRYVGRYPDGVMTPEDEQIQRTMSESRGGELLSLLPRTSKRISVLDIGLSAEAEARFEEVSSQYGVTSIHTSD